MARAGAMAVLLALAASAGCGPLRTGPAVTAAEEAIQAALAGDLAKDAPYEITLARRSLDLAREARGRAEYSAAQRFAETASRLCQEARQAAPRNRAAREAREAAAREDARKAAKAGDEAARPLPAPGKATADPDGPGKAPVAPAPLAPTPPGGTP